VDITQSLYGCSRPVEKRARSGQPLIVSQCVV
jgi:hypothetical protein